jgi:glycosyltransferase involved in cell wall biosynthesis
MSPRRILHILGSAAHAGTAQAKVVTALAAAGDTDRYHVSAWFLGDDGPLMDVLGGAGVESRVLAPGRARDVAAAMRIARAVRAEQPAIVHLHAGGRARLWPLRAAAGAKVVAHLHAARHENGTPLPLGHLLRRADAVIATSQAVAMEARTQAIVIHPGVVIPAQRVPIHADRPPIVGTVGRLEPVKGLGALFQVAPALIERHPDLRIEIVGRGSCEPMLRDVASLHRRWRMFAQPSLHEGFGIAVLEAMASGLPVVASAAGGLPELVEDGVTGLLCPAGDPHALAERLDRLMGDAALCASLGVAGRRRAADHFDVANMVARIEAVYARLLES